MSEDKYYTPSIEELHIGFIYEEYIAGSGNDYTVVSFDYDHWKFISAVYEQNLQEGWIRVKYIDKEDIESFGWSKENNNFEQLDTNLLFLNSITLSKKVKHNIYYISALDTVLEKCHFRISIWNSETMKPNEEATIFIGTIKNKSEFKVLLKQLGIE